MAACIADLDGKRVATSFAALVTQAAAKAGVHVELVELDGAVETAVELGLADAIADVVEAGASLQAAGLDTIGEKIMHSEAVLVRGARDGAAHPSPGCDGPAVAAGARAILVTSPEASAVLTRRAGRCPRRQRNPRIRCTTLNRDAGQ